MSEYNQIKELIDRQIFLTCFVGGITLTCLTYVMLLYTRVSKMNDNMITHLDKIFNNFNFTYI